MTIKTCSLFLILTIVVTEIFSQTISELDQKNGFKKFLFGTENSKIQNIEKTFRGVRLKDVSEYKYVGNDISELSGAPIESLHLSFYKNKLYKISVEFGSPINEYSDLQFQGVQLTLQSSFGKSYNLANYEQADMLVLQSSFWESKKIHLEHTRVNLRPLATDKYNHIVGYILYTDLNLDRQQKKGELDAL